MTDFFNFEDKEWDLPFYNGVPKLSFLKWGLLVLGVILFLAVLYVPININELVFAVLLVLVTLLPTLYALGKDWKMMFRLPERKDIKPLVVVVILEIVYSLGMLFLLSSTGLFVHNPAQDAAVTVTNIISMIIKVFGEELFKIILILLVMTVLYRFLNRKISIVISSLAVAILFGFLHAGFYGGILNVILIQGISSLFDIYLYIKTKNVTVSYTCHMLFDLIVMLPALLGI